MRWWAGCWTRTSIRARADGKNGKQETWMFTVWVRNENAFLSSFRFLFLFTRWFFFFLLFIVVVVDFILLFSFFCLFFDSFWKKLFFYKKERNEQFYLFSCCVYVLCVVCVSGSSFFFTIFLILPLIFILFLIFILTVFRILFHLIRSVRAYSSDYIKINGCQKMCFFLYEAAGANAHNCIFSRKLCTNVRYFLFKNKKNVYIQAKSFMWQIERESKREGERKWEYVLKWR